MTSKMAPIEKTRLPESRIHPKTSGKVRDLIWNINRIQRQGDRIEDLTSENCQESDTLRHLTSDLANAVISNATKDNHRVESTTSIFPYIGTVKLHGTHADIVFQPDGTIECQSRNCYLTQESDSYGFAAFCDSRKTALIGVREAIEKRWHELHPGLGVSKEEPIIVAGEWIGTGIQRNVAISQLSKRFVICGIRINGTWEPIEELRDISNEDALIFNINRGALYHLEFSTQDEGKAFTKEAERLTMGIVASCPYAKTFEIEGAGEGIVWTPAKHSALPNKPEFWLKTKSENFKILAPATQPVLKNPALVGRSARAKKFAGTACSEARMDQAWEYLKEMGLGQSKRSLGPFLSWLWNDIEVEEKIDIKELDIGSEWKIEGTRIAKTWYEAKLM